MSDLTITIPGWLLNYLCGCLVLALIIIVVFAVFLNKSLDAGRDNWKRKP